MAIASLAVGSTVRATIDANPSLCMPDPTDEDTANATDLMTDYPDCPAAVDIAVTMTFVYAMFLVSINNSYTNLLIS